jgi:hypothetical protein
MIPHTEFTAIELALAIAKLAALAMCLFFAWHYRGDSK